MNKGRRLLSRTRTARTCWLSAIAGSFLMGAAACSSSSEPKSQSGTGGGGAADASAACGIGDTRSCLGPAACEGAQVCLPDRSGFGECDCGSAGSGGAAPVDAGADADSGAGGLDPALVPGPSNGKPCVLPQQCEPGESCQISSATSLTCGVACVPAASCSDTCNTNAECRIGTQCYAGLCARLCSPALTGGQDTCVADNKKCLQVGHLSFGVCT